MKANRFLIILFAISIFSQNTLASEGFVYGGPIGGTDIGGAYLPPPGLYGIFLGGSTYDTTLNGNDGKAIENAQFGIHDFFGAAALLYVYPFTIADGRIASSAYQDYGYYHLTSFGKSGYTHGFGDLYSDIISWSRHVGSTSADGLPRGLTVKLAYSMIFPTGQYTKGQFSGSAGHNVYYFIPNMALTYLTGPNFLGNGTEFSLQVFFDMATKNSATGYSSGNVIDFDAAITERLNSRWQIGVAGNYATQITDDRQDGVTLPNGNRFGFATVGPVVQYLIPQWKSQVKLKVSLPVWGRNYNLFNAVVLSFAKKF
ncbi:SphA family protein [Paraburkholderia tropica]|uniref:SphA family protein n=1 Tax=Paraburkholderia tropica TaxID=92647 RepID=UPI002AB664DD|nr:transporter [Paraburkholderia tropica]